jgi:hypothetical protein
VFGRSRNLAAWADSGHACAGQEERLPKLKFTPDPVDFGKVPVDQSSSITVTVENTSKTESADVLTISAKPNPPFSIDTVNTTCAPGELAPGATCDLVLVCKPNKEKKFKGEAAFTFGTKGCKPQEVKLECDGVAPAATPTATATMTLTPTPTRTATPTVTATPSVSATPTTTRSATPTTTSTGSPTATTTATPTATATPKTYGTCSAVNTLSSVQYPSVAINGNTASVTVDNGIDIFGTYSFNGGMTWSSPLTNLTNNTGGDTASHSQTFIDTSDNTLHVAYEFLKSGTTAPNIPYLKFDPTDFKLLRGPLTPLTACGFPAITARNGNVYMACGASSNDVFYTSSLGGGPFSAPVNVFGATAQLTVPTIAIYVNAGLAITGQGLDSSGNQAIFEKYSMDGINFSSTFKMYSAAPGDSLFISAPNTQFAGKMLTVFGTESTASSSSLVTIWGDPTGSMPSFMSAQIGSSQIGQEFSFSPAGCLTNPPSWSAAIIGRNPSNAVYLAQTPDLTSPIAYSAKLLDSNNDVQLGAACNALQGIFGIGFGDVITYRCF